MGLLFSSPEIFILCQSAYSLELIISFSNQHLNNAGNFFSVGSPLNTVKSCSQTDTVTAINTGLTPLYFRMNEEIRWTFPWKTWKRWQIVQFYDWTRVVDSEGVYKERECESFGFGIRYRWQFLTFRLDYAFKKDLSNWNPEAFGWGRFAFDLSQTF